MPSVIVRHDQPIANALRDEREALTVVRAETEADCLATLSEADVFVTNPTNWTDEYLDGLSAGDWVQATSAGYAAFPLDEFEANDIAFTNAGGNYGHPVADHAFALLLGLARQLPRCFENQRRGEWDRDLGTDLLDLQGRTLTVVGLGDIGEEVARRGRAFGMDVFGTKRDPDAYDGCLPTERVRPSGDLFELLPETDTLVVAVPLTEATHHLVDEAALETLPNSAMLVNVARGPVIDEAALTDALAADRLAGAGLDVFEEEPLPEESPLWDREDVIVTPHVGGRSRAFIPRFVELFLENYDRRRAGDALRNRIV
ncbi:D-2-hydroxyacid dehydrogenase [Natrinema salifodinae]|uniref:D-2-hydroxyacid dehydrogenase (NADP+) n=1 Tax=Natrinema salifodinae TaxID=1202768 RepID=A0A1I0LY52_9EURY|nr:D-2-hydroxyacid dehydrogenase [Natrinema salifodinae]SEV80013.1 D-2-hydroxyacid dehydrogenase (NADP+) [Natrinema salifodinae]